MELQSVVRGLPCCFLKRIEAREVLNDMEALTTISMGMRKAQLKALLQGVSHERGGPPSKLYLQDVWEALVCTHGDSLEYD